MLCAMSSVSLSTYRDLFSVFIFEYSCFLPYCAEAKVSMMYCIELCQNLSTFIAPHLL